MNNKSNDYDKAISTIRRSIFYWLFEGSQKYECTFNDSIQFIEVTGRIKRRAIDIVHFTLLSMFFTVFGVYCLLTSKNNTFFETLFVDFISGMVLLSGGYFTFAVFSARKAFLRSLNWLTYLEKTRFR